MIRGLVLSLLIAATALAANAGGSAPAVDPAARRPEGAEAAERWDLAAHFDSGHRLYVRFLITNAGPGDASAVAFGNLVLPDGRAVEFRNGRRAGRWQLSPDRRRIRIGSSELAFADRSRHFEVDNDKRGIKIRLDLPDDGAALSAPAPLAGYRVDLLNLATPATGSFWLDGMAEPQPLSGRAALTHTWFPGAESERVARRLDVFSMGAGPRLFLCQVDPPRGPAWRWWVGGDESGIWALPDPDFRVAGGTGGSYPVPGRIDMGDKNPTGRILFGQTALTVDPMAALPALLRMVYSFGRHPRLLWVDTVAEVVLKSPSRDAVLQIEGAGIATLDFLDSTPP